MRWIKLRSRSSRRANPCNRILRSPGRCKSISATAASPLRLHRAQTPRVLARPRRSPLSISSSKPRLRAERSVRAHRAALPTRDVILNAAHRRLIDGGPEAIRLEKIAADAGVSHPAILHHFGSREGLVEAMVLDSLQRLQAQLLEGWPSAKEPDVEGTFTRLYELASRRGVARML